MLKLKGKQEHRKGIPGAKKVQTKCIVSAKCGFTGSISEAALKYS